MARSLGFTPNNVLKMTVFVVIGLVIVYRVLPANIRGQIIGQA